MPNVYTNDSMKIHYEIDGEGPALILLHGLGNNSRSWEKQILGLKDEFTVIAWDAPGYGASSDPEEEIKHFSEFAAILKEMIHSLGMKQVHLLGHSMGSAIATEFCYAYPEMVKGLILADATRGGSALDPEDNQRKLDERLHMIDTLPPRELAGRRIKNLLSPNVSTEVLRTAENIMSQVRPKGYRSVAYSLYNANVDRKFSAIQAPTLLICGELDKVTPVSESESIQSKINQAELEIIPDSGHLCYQEKPEEFNSLVRRFLTKFN